VTKTNCLNAINNFVQMVNTTVTSPIAITAAIPVDNTIPQQTEGTEILTATITPQKLFNTLEIKVFLNYTNINSELATCAIFQDSGADALAATCFARQYNNSWYMSFYPVVSSTATTTYKVRVGLNTSTSGLNINADNSGNRFFGGVSNTSLVIFEYNA
jgi:hypothetical protein